MLGKHNKFRDFSAIAWCREPDCDRVYVMLDKKGRITAGDILPCGHQVASAVFNRHRTIKRILDMEGEDE